ncbi:hypothetical protein M422DRAFT_51443 [Sphaerobolus stellatus SS14]|uniref:Unplaced genomic scaffold SPHSTscaffold_112, whole genome shotgun sequence n=1 Tax=Sphaerobolus stellatus (strain SS14) TaxID=990650 RepID=A0A0C9TYL1_SPHS4|nr:hypothetical protein M422DRAFT_51443 [Sphaerobolus stellatus SS14]
MAPFRIKVKGLRGLPAIEKRKWEREPRFYLSVYICDKRKDTSKIVQRDSLEWNEYIELLSLDNSSTPTPTPDADLRLLLYRAHTIKEDEGIFSARGMAKASFQKDIKLEGYSTLNMTDNVIHLQFQNRTLRNDDLDVIICFFGDEDLHQQAHLVNKNTNSAIERIDSSEPNDVVDRAIAGPAMAENSLDPWMILLDRIDVIMRITEKLSQVHPYAAMASSVLLGTYKVCIVLRLLVTLY